LKVIIHCMCCGDILVTSFFMSDLIYWDHSVLGSSGYVFAILFRKTTVSLKKRVVMDPQ